MKAYAKNHKCLIRIILPEITLLRLKSDFQLILSHWWLMVSLESCQTASLYLLVLGDISSSICLHIVSDYVQSCNPLNPDRQETADLYSSGLPHNVTAWRESRSEWARMCVWDTCPGMYIPGNICFLFMAADVSTHPALQKLISLFMREMSSKRRQMKIWYCYLSWP